MKGARCPNGAGECIQPAPPDLAGQNYAAVQLFEGMTATSVAAACGFGVSMLVFYLRTVRRLRRNPRPGGTVRLDARGCRGLILLFGVLWSAICLALFLAVYLQVPSYVVSIGAMILIAGIRPMYVALDGRPFVICEEGKDPSDYWKPSGRRARWS